jgi:hypothetical protein
MRFAGGTLLALLAFIMATAAGYAIVTYTDWLGRDWRVAPILGLLGYLFVRILASGWSAMRRG